MNQKTKIMTETAISVALAVVCSYVRLWTMPQGGTVALTMLPILLLSFRRGAAAGCTAGAVFGILHQLLDGVVYHPMSILLDYLLAFGILGIAGFFPKTQGGIICGSCLAVCGRFISSVVSGAVLFASFAPEGQNPWLYSVIYQLTYMLPELLLCVAVLCLLYWKGNLLFFPKKM